MKHSSHELSKQDSFSRRLWAYLQERFPLVNHGLLIVSYYSSNQFLATTLTYPGSAMHYSFNSLLGAITVFCLFFHLRVFDEHKDYEEDCRYYPDRILSRGLISLDQLKILGGIAIGLEITCAAIRGLPALTAVLIALGFSLLMLKEFFMRDWLKRHFLVYATTHMFIMPLLALVVYSFTTGRYPWQAPGWFWLYAFVGFFVSFNWEISRKIRTPEDEITGVDSYSKIFGTYGAAYSVIGIRVIDTLMVSLVGWHLGLSLWFYVVLTGLFLVCLNGFIQFKRKTTRKNARRLELYAGMYIIAFDLTLAIELLCKYGITF